MSKAALAIVPSPSTAALRPSHAPTDALSKTGGCRDGGDPGAMNQLVFSRNDEMLTRGAGSWADWNVTWG
jgi:hypothetical protein